MTKNEFSSRFPHVNSGVVWKDSQVGLLTHGEVVVRRIALMLGMSGNSIRDKTLVDEVLGTVMAFCRSPNQVFQEENWKAEEIEEYVEDEQKNTDSTDTTFSENEAGVPRLRSKLLEVSQVHSI